MSATKFDFSLHKLHKDSWVATLSYGTQEVTITASSIPSEPLLPLLWAVRLLLMGTSEARCSWWEEPGEYRWLFKRQDGNILMHILWFKNIARWSDEKGQTVLQMECDLYAFAKRLSQQINQLSYQEKRPAIPPHDYQLLQEALLIYERENCG